MDAVALAAAKVDAAKRYGSIFGQRRHDLLPVASAPRVMASPPTVTVAGPFSGRVGNSAIAGSPQWVAIATSLAGGEFNFIGATPGGTSLTNQSEASGAETPPYQLEFFYTGSQVELWVVNGSQGSTAYRLKINDEYVSLTPTFPIGITSSSAYTRININFGSLDTRKVTVEANNLALIGYYRDPAGLVWPTHTRPDRVAFLGDSFVSGSVADSAIQGWAFHTSRLLRWGHPWLLGQGGTGYLNPGTGAKATFINRLPDVAASNAEVLVLSGGFNDKPSVNAAYTATALQAAVTALLAALPASCPKVKKVYVVGAWQPNGSPSAELTAANNAVKAAALAASNVSAFIDTTGWVTGIGWAGASVPAMTPTGPVVAASGGTFTAGAYDACVTSLTARGETTPSAVQTATVTANGTLQWMWNPVTFATGYNLYRRSSPAGTWAKIASATTQTNVVDTGAAGTAVNPPSSDTSGNPAGNLSDVITSTDSTHPTNAGHAYYGHRIAAAIAATLA